MFSLLVAGRNLSWRELLKETFTSEFLVSQIKRRSDSMLDLHGILFKLLLDIHVDVQPLERISVPSMIRFVGEISASYSLGESLTRIRTLIAQNETYPKNLPVQIASQLTDDFSHEVEQFCKSQLNEITTQIVKCKTKEEILVEDLPPTLIDSLKFILELMQLSVFGVMESEALYQSILSSCFKIFNYSVRLPENFALLTESQREIAPALTKRLRLSFSLSKPVKGKPKLLRVRNANDTGVTEAFDKNSLIQGNYYTLKNEVFNALELSDTRKTRRDLEAKHLILGIISRLLDSRQQFLMDNYTEWVRNISAQLPTAEYSVELEQQAFLLCEQQVHKVIPTPIPTGLQKIDTPLLRSAVAII